MNLAPKTMAVVLSALAELAAMAEPVQGLSWSDGSSYIEIGGSTLTVTRDNAASGAILSKASVDLSGLLDDGLGLVMTMRVRAEGVTEPASPSGGVKFMLAYRDADDGAMHYASASVPTGTYGWIAVTNRVNVLTAPFNPEPGTTQICIGLQGCTGLAEFDLSSLDIATEDVGVAPVNQDWVVRYPDWNFDAGSAGGEVRRPLRGFMLPARDVTEQDMDDLATWRANLLRFQIRSEGHALGVEDADQDLEEYAAWVDSRLDNLESVLRWAAERGMKVAVDLHSPPGGKHTIDGVRTMNMFFEERFADAFVETWRCIARRFRGHPAIYGYDLVNEPEHRMPVPFSYWELQRRAAEAIRAIDPDTAIIVESNLSDNAEAYRYLSPLAMDNVIYQVHLYKPYEYTHQGVGGNPLSDSSGPFSYPSASRGWTHELIREVLAPVLAFQQKHRCRIFVGEFSAAAWAPGADLWLRDCIDIFEECGWDWTYLSFRGSGIFSIEHEPIEPGRAGDYNFLPSIDNPRRSAILDTLLRAPDSPWFSSGFDTNGEERVVGGRWADGVFSASQARGGIARVEAVVTPNGGFDVDHLPRLLAEAVEDGCAAAVVCVEDDAGDLSLRGFVSDGGTPAWMRLEGFAPVPGEPFRFIAELDATNGIPRVRYAAAVESQIVRLRSATGDTWLPAPCAPAIQTAGSAKSFAGRVAFSGEVAVSALAGAAPDPGPPIVFGAVTGADSPAFTNAVVTLQVAEVGEQILPGAVLRMSVFAGTPANGVAQSSPRLLGTVERLLDGPGAYVFDTAGAIAPEAFDGLLSCHVVFSLVNFDGTVASGAPFLEDSISFSDYKAWFSARAKSGISRVRGGRWLSQPPVLGDAFASDPVSAAVFEAASPRDGLVRVEAVLVPEGGYGTEALEFLLEETGGRQAAVAVCEDSDGALFLCGLASGGGTPAWVPLEGAASTPVANAPLRIAAELDYTGEYPKVSYLASSQNTAPLPEGGGGEAAGGRSAGVLSRLRSPSGAVWLPACAPATPTGGSPRLSGGVAFSGSASVLSFVGTSAVKYKSPQPFTGTFFLIQ